MFGMIPVPPGEDPDEFFAKLRAEQEEQEKKALMKNQDLKHKIWDFIGDLSIDDLRTFRDFLMTIESGGPDLLHFFLGLVSGRLKYEHNLCPGCGVDHFTELLSGDSDNEPEK